MWDLVFKIGEKIFNWFFSLGKGKREAKEGTKKVLFLLTVKFKELSLYLEDFGNHSLIEDPSLIGFRSKINSYKDKLTYLVALFSIKNPTISEDMEVVRNVLNDILKTRLLIDGGRSWRELCVFVQIAKKKADDFVNKLGELT